MKGDNGAILIELQLAMPIRFSPSLLLHGLQIFPENLDEIVTLTHFIAFILIRNTRTSITNVR